MRKAEGEQDAGVPTKLNHVKKISKTKVKKEYFIGNGWIIDSRNAMVRQMWKVFMCQ